MTPRSAQARLARSLALTTELLRIPTVAEREGVAAELCAEVLSAAGWDVELIPFAEGRLQLLASSGEGPIDRCLTGHLDTVAVSEGEWSVDPFAGLIADGQVWGRGSADMKGGVAAILAAAEGQPASERRPGTGILLTAAEETGAEGAAAIAAHPALESVTQWVVAEPTANRISVGHRGVIWLRLRCRGEAGHASAAPADGGAIGELRRALDRLGEIELDALPDPLLGNPTLAVTVLSAGQAPNVLPASASAVIDVRSTGSFGAGELKARILGAVGDAVEVTWLKVLPAVAGPREGPLARQVSCLAGSEVERRGVNYFTDLSCLARPSSEIVIYGPGEPAQAHAVDEHCSIDAILAAGDVYRGLLAA